MLRSRILGVLALGGLLACGEGAVALESLPELQVGCAGKCDGLDSVRSLLRDPSELSLDDLVRLGAGLATDELNDALSTEAVGVEIEGAEHHTAEEIDELVTGLADAFGERELTTQVNKLRRDHLASSSDEAYAEMSITLSPGLARQWGADRPGFDEENTRIGFDAGVAAKVAVILPVRENGDDPLSSIRTLREFVVPRNLEDVREMAPGEVFSIHGAGRLGANFGAGVPILIAEPTTAITYSVVLSAGLRTTLTGELDVQLVRLDDGEVVVDVGLSKVKQRSVGVALEDGWGVQGLLDSQIDMSGVDGVVDLAELVDDALTDQLDKRLNLLHAHATRTEEATRMSVARMRFDLDAADPELAETAISHAMRGDVRLAQALSARDEQGIEVEFDLLRSGMSTTSSFGVELFGLDFLRRKVEETGSIVVQTPGGAMSLLFNSLHRSKKLFSPRTGYTRVGVAGLLFGPDAPPTGEANLFVELEERDKTMQRDKLLDHLDSIILGVGGADALDAVAKPGDNLERLVRAECAGSRAFDDCPIDMVEDARVLALRDAGHDAVAGAVGDLPNAMADLVLQVADLKLLMQGTYEIGGSAPGTSVVVDVRLDDGALAQVLGRKSGEDLRKAGAAFLAMAEVDRHLEGSDRTNRLEAVASGSGDKLAAMADRFDAAAAEYQALMAAEDADIESVGLIGPQAVEIRFTVDSDRHPIYEDATARSVAQARSEVVMDLFDGLRNDAKGLGPHPEQTAAYVLLALTDAERSDVRVDLGLEIKESLLHWRGQYRAAMYPETVDLRAEGPAVEPIDGGLFDIDALIEGE